MKKAAFLLGVVIMMASCGPTLKVFSDYDAELKVTDYKTYTWLPLQTIEGKGNNPLYYNELNDKRIKDAVNSQMEAKGYKMVTGGVPGLEIHYHILVEDKLAVMPDIIGPNVTPYDKLGDKNFYPNIMGEKMFQYREGTLIIDVMDKQKDKLVWRGWASDVITDTQRKDPGKAIKKAVIAIFKKYPF